MKLFGRTDAVLPEHGDELGRCEYRAGLCVPQDDDGLHVATEVSYVDDRCAGVEET